MKNLFHAVRTRYAAWRVVFTVLGATIVLLGLGACADTEREADNAAMLPDDQRVGTVPWSRPEKWESTGQLGQIANDPRFQNH